MTRRSDEPGAALDDPVTKRRSKRKALDQAAITPLLGFVLLASPLAAAMDSEHIGGGALVGYIFAVWAALIAATAYNAQRLCEATEPEEDAGGEEAKSWALRGGEPDARR